MSRMKKVGIGIGALALAALFLLPVTGSRLATPTPSGTTMAPAGREAAGTPGTRVAAEGRVTTYPGAEVRVGTERAGLLTGLTVKEGDVVEAGERIATIDDQLLRDGLAEIEARLGEADAEIRLSRLTLGRRESLAERQVVASETVDQSRRDLAIAEARRTALEAQAARIRTEIRKSRVTVPISGTIIARHADAGEILEAGSPIVTVANLARVRVEAEADESDAGLVRVGDPVRITADGWPGIAWQGHVEEVPGWVESRRLKSRDPARPSDTRVLMLKVAFDETVPLKLGQTVEVMVAAGGR